MRFSLIEALIAIFCTGAIMFLLRILPFLVFRKKKVPAFFSFIEKYIPPISIAVLFIVCFKEKTSDILISGQNLHSDFVEIINAVIGAAVTALLHIWKKNAMVSIFGGTICFMLLNYFI